MKSPSADDLRARLTALEARVDVLAADRPEKLGSRGTPADAASLDDVLMRLSELAGEARRLLHGRGGPVNDDDCLLLAAVSDGHGQRQAQVTSLSAVVRDEADEGIAALAGALGHPLRVRILKLLVAGERSARDVGEAAGLEGGPLYHHLRALTTAGLVQQPERSRYRLTNAGLRQLLYIGGLHRSLRADNAPRTGAGEDGGGRD